MIRGWQLVCGYSEVMDRANKLRSLPAAGAGSYPEDHGHSHLSGFWKLPCVLPKNEQP